AREVGETGRADLKARLEPLLAPILAGRADGPLYLSGQLLAARLNVGGVDAVAVRRVFVAPDQPDATRLQALEALIAFREPTLLDAVGQVLSSGSPSFLTQVLN